MSSEWTRTTIGSQATLQRGFDITKASQREGSVPVVSSAGVSSFHDTAMVRGPGVVLGRKGVVGSVHFVPGDYWPHDTTLWVKDFHGNSERFVYYFFLSRARELASLDVGSANPTLNRNHVHPIQVAWPHRAEQVAIAALLTGLDDRIALLRDTNATLEAIAQALFKSWFVDFDPVRAKSQGLAPAGMDEATAALFPDGFEESEKGGVPQGWRWVSLRDAVSIHDSKRIPLSGQDRAKRRGPYPYYGAAALMDHVDDYLFEGPHVLVGEDGSVTQPDGMPVLQYVWDKFWVNNHAHVLQGANGICTEHVLLSLRTTNIQHLVTGAVQAKLSQGNMWRIDFMRPSREVAGAFASVIEPLFARFRQNAEQAHSLAEIRDTLLPRLISGQLRVPLAEETP